MLSTMAWASPASAPTIGEPEEHPASLRGTLDEPGLGHQLQMPADARLALAKDLGQVLDVQLAVGKQRQDAQTGRLACSAERREALRARQARMGVWLGHHLT